MQRAHWPRADLIRSFLCLSTVGSVIACALPARADDTQPALATPSPSPSPSPSALRAAAGPCENPPVTAVTTRPGIGRASATSGSVCAAPRDTVVLGVGYRNQETTATARQTLVTYPQPIVLVGLGNANELILAPSLSYSRRSGNAGTALLPASGLEDAGAGFQHTLSDGPVFQTAAQAFMTIPTGYPSGSSGFSAGAPTFQLTYSVAYSATANLSLSAVNALLVASGADPWGIVSRYAGIQETLGLSYALSPTTALLMQDQISGPRGPSGNRALIAFQQGITSRLAADLDYEVNLLPTPGSAQHTTFEFGLSVLLDGRSK